jgi:hypothetical protein
VPIIDNYSMTRQLYKAHIYMEGAGWDCNHYCSPGVPEVNTKTGAGSWWLGWSLIMWQPRCWWQLVLNAVAGARA